MRALSQAVGLGWAVLAGLAGAAEVEKAALRIERVALFKNGLGYFTSSATLPEKATRVDLGRIPVPSHGTFWVTCPKGVAVRGLVTSPEEVRDTVPVRSLGELIAANAGRKATLHTSSTTMPAIEGTILAMSRKDTPTEPANPYVMRPRSSESRDREVSEASSMAVLWTAQGIVAVSVGSVIGVRIEGGEAVTAVPATSQVPRILLDLERPAGGQKVTVTYLASGITWAPSYLVDLSDPKTARLTAQTLILNEVADLDSVHLDLVTGFPQAQWAEITSPIAMTQSLADFLKALVSGRSEESERGSNYRISYRNGRIVAYGPEVGNIPALDQLGLPPVADAAVRVGAAAEDLFLYPIERVSHRRSEVACIPLFVADAPYEHVYIWKPRAADEEPARRKAEPDARVAEEVWHCCRITNPLKIPWTTAPTQFIAGGQFVGQDTCYYTPPGMHSTLRINLAVNLLASQSELEMERGRQEVTIRGVAYTRTTIKGELKLRSRLDRPATIETTKEVTGTVRDTTPKATDTAKAEGAPDVNPHHTLFWRIVLKPGEEQTLGYTCEVLTRN